MEKDSLELAHKKFLRNYHDAYYRLFHLPLDWVGTDCKTFTICGKSHCNSLCVRIMECAEGAACCQKMEQKQYLEAQKTRQPVVTRCHAGFCDATIPIYVDNKYLGSLCIGQYLNKMPDDEELKKICADLSYLKITPEELKEYYQKTKILTDEEASGLIDLVKMLGEYICESYGKMRFLESSESSDPIRTAQQYIQNHYAKTLTVAGIARAVCMSTSYFSHKFIEQTGMSPINYLNGFRVEKAIELLQETKLPISEVASLCGFPTISHFNTQFHKITGKTPSSFRKEDSNQTPPVKNI